MRLLAVLLVAGCAAPPDFGAFTVKVGSVGVDGPVRDMAFAFPDDAAPVSDLAEDGTGDDAGRDVPDLMRPSDLEPAPPPSCAGLAATCGANGNGDCCESPIVPGGMYWQAFDVAGDAYSGTMRYAATVSAFRLDRYETTVGRFRKFVMSGHGTQAKPPAAGAGANPKINGSGWDPQWDASLPVDTAALVTAVKCSAMYQTWTDQPGANETLPANCIDWYEAFAFCIWDGGRLPTNAEWGYAASGGDEQRAYPWSNPPSSLLVDGTYASFGCGGNCSFASIVPVGSLPDGSGRWGHADLAGNMIEWTRDWYAPLPQNCADCANITPAMSIVTRGGAFGTDARSLRSSDQTWFSAPNFNAGSSGFRCARAK